MLGDVGHLGIIISLVSALIAAFCYGKSQYAIDINQKAWVATARQYFIVHFAGALLAAICLFLIIYKHQYQYHYAWKHSSNSLPFHFIIACFWEGQEGSFLVWIIWNALLGGILFRTARDWEPSVMLVFSIIQVTLVTMVLGAYFGSGFRLGSSPFMLLNEALSAPVFDENPNFVPQDGTGLNPLLQNIWMVIHPPVIFLGFALSAVPFAFCVAALFRRDRNTWIKPAQIWLLIGVGVLGAGIMMGAYWAYETLNFGGYWNWDPVENAILIPWLVMLAALHGMVLYQKRGKGLLFTTVLVLSSFVLIVYATFLTRSGILGNSSVHAFTDLGLSGQLLFFLLLAVVGVVCGLVYNWKNLQPGEVGEVPIYSLTVWLNVGIVILCLAAFQILLPTSFPVINKLAQWVGFQINLAPPVDQVGFYSKFQLWFAVMFGVVSGVAQLIYYKGVSSLQSLERRLSKPLLISLAIAIMVILLGKVSDWPYILLITSALYGFVSCITVVFHAVKLKKTSYGGAMAHGGFALMLIGFVFSAGYAEVVSQNLKINAPQSSLPIHTVQEHALLNRNKATKLSQYQFTYSGLKQKSPDGRYTYDKDGLLNTTLPNTKVLITDQFEDGRQIGFKGDTVIVNPENTYYHIKVSGGDRSFDLMPRMQNNPQMGYVASPAITSLWDKDLYLHVTNFPDPEKVKWGDPEYFEIIKGEEVSHSGLKIALQDVGMRQKVAGVEINDGDIPIVAEVEIDDGQNRYTAYPVYMIKNGKVRLYPYEIKALGLKTMIQKINPSSGKVTLSVITSQRDWITIKAIEMPHISLVWIGTLLMLFGVGVAVYAKLAMPVTEPALEAETKNVIKGQNFASVIIESRKVAASKG